MLLAGAAATKIFAVPQGPARSTSEAPKEPVFIYLYAKVTDHVNLDLTEDRLRRLLPMIEKYRKDHPDAHVSATILFSGAVSRALAERNGQTHIRDFVLDFGRRGVVEFGYDGSDEPTYENRPVLDFSNAKSIDDRWMVRETLAEKVLTEARDPLTGAPQAGSPGGLKEMQEVFGKAACITGVPLQFRRMGAGTTSTPRARGVIPPPVPRPSLPTVPVQALVPEIGSDSETVQQIHKYDSTAIMFGLPDTNPAKFAGFRVAEDLFSKSLSPQPDTSPELYWQDNVLRSSEASGDIVRLVHASDGPDALEKMLGKLERSKIHIIHVELGSEQDYVQPTVSKDPNYALTYAYSHVDHPQLPAEARRAPSDVDAAYGKEQSLLNWLATDFFPANPGSRFISSTDMERMAQPSTGFSISVGDLRAFLTERLAGLEHNTNPEAYVEVDHHYLSMADLYQVMTDALAEFGRTGKFPDSVQVIQVYGPLYTYTGHGPNAGEVTVADLLHYCEGVAVKLHDSSATPVPKNIIPTSATINGVAMSSAQVMRLMMEAMVNPSQQEKLQVKMTYTLSGLGAVSPKSRPPDEVGGTWTLKPAVLEIKQLGASQQ
jgi:hypothetical protein